LDVFFSRSMKLLLREFSDSGMVSGCMKAHKNSWYTDTLIWYFRYSIMWLFVWIMSLHWSIRRQSGGMEERSTYGCSW